MTLSTNLISGLSSGFDWRSVVDKLMAIERRPVDLLEQKKSDYESQLSEWQSFNTKLLALRTAAQALQEPDDFNIYTANMTSDSADVDASDLLSVSASSSASVGSYSIQITNIATAQKLSSASFSSITTALGSSYAGDLLINGKAVTITATDTLSDVRDKINNANAGDNPTGVTASIITYGTNDYRLTLTSDSTGEEGISLQNASSTDLVELFGWKDKSTSLKNSITGGAQSDLFSSTTQDIKTLLGLSTTQSGTIQIAGQNISIDFSTDSLEGIKTKINDASIPGVTASIITDTSGDTTQYRLQIDGTQSFTDDQNILETLGILENGVSAVQGTTSGNTMTADGENISASTLLTSIDGYNSWTSGDSITISGTDHSGNAVNDSFSITSSSTVQDLMNAIETAFEAGGDEVSVYVTSDGKIEVADLETGSSSLSVSLTSSISDGSLDWGTFTALGTVRNRQLTAGQDATLSVDGVTVTRSENTIDDLIPGVTLNLLDSDSGTTVTLNIARDIDAIVDKINDFVNAYNDVASYINQQQSYDEDKQETGGVLFGDGTLNSVEYDLTSTLVQNVWGVSTEFSTLGLVGLNLDHDGQLSIDSDTLKGYLRTNFNDIKLLFAANGVTSTGTLEYVSYSRDTEAGEYTVNITQAATRSNSTSDTAVSGTLGSDETLTITEGDKTATISLTSSMTISDIINAINTELDTVYTEKLVGANALTASSSPITSSTTWGSIDGANLVDGDVISFSGTTRNGTAVSGSYTISDASSDTVQDLLSEIESAFGNSVTAAIDSTGHLTLTDKYEGNSQLSITFDYTQAHDLDFGSVLTTNSGGQEGRYAIEITASNDGSDHLVLTHDSYGSSYSFTIQESTDTGLWTGSQTTPVSVNNGVDVAGTINGESATGSGQLLTGDDGEANIDGLVIKYTGTTTGDVGTVKITLGAAELFDRVLYSITDPLEGYVGFKQDSLQDTIDDYELKIEQMEARLDQKMEMMINRFVAMELALSNIQAQSQWLSGQINAMSYNW